jgi:hypothetical protein
MEVQLAISRTPGLTLLPRHRYTRSLGFSGL